MADKIISTFKDSPPFELGRRRKIQSMVTKRHSRSLYRLRGFHRAEKSSKSAKNPAASDKTTDSVTIYDEFYKRSNKETIVGHEMAHLLFKKLSPDDITSFTDLAGWTIKVEGNQVFEVPPGKVLIRDSIIDKEEDFANSVEIFFTDPSRLRNHNQKLFDFFQKRFSK